MTTARDQRLQKVLLSLILAGAFAGASCLADGGDPATGTPAAGGGQDESIATVGEALTSVRNSCVCTGLSNGQCGNGATGGGHGDVRTNISTATMISSFGPDRSGSLATGWACRPQGTNSCVCVGINSGGGCGNGAVGGDFGSVQTGISTASAIRDFGPDRAGAERTGWKCRLSGI